MEKITSIMELIRWVAVQEHVSELMVQPGAVVRYLKRYFGIHAEGKLPPALWQQCLRENMSLNDLLRQVFPLLEADEIDRILRKEEKDTVLDVYGIDFSQQAREGNFQFLTERPESSSMAAILKKAQKPNVLLVGPSRSGKTSLVHLLARQHPEWKIYGFSLAGILSGTPYRGMAEERMEQIIAAATETGSILFFDEAHQLLTHSELVNQLKPYLSDNPNFRCIAATTTEEHRRFENDRAIMERFTVLKINPMIKDDQSNAFVKKANEMSLKHKISLSHVLVLQAEKMACLLFKDTCLDNFIDLIDIACVLATDQNCEEVALSHLITAASIHSGWDPNDIINLL